VIAGAVLFFILWIRTASRPFRRINRHRISAVKPAGIDAVTFHLQPVDGNPLVFEPGQFAYLRLRSGAVSKEEHPFSLVAPPDNVGELQVTIRCAGDWTGFARRLQPGDLVDILGPYGHFSDKAFAPARRLVFIAGGVGITPMLSMLHRLAADKDRRPFTLIWSNRTRQDLIRADDIDALRQRLPGFKVVHRFTRDPDDPDTGRIDRPLLAKEIGPGQPGTLLFLCGPGDFIKQMRGHLKRLGFAGRDIKTEAFRF
jgi:ferredoxin-NADP reductase